MIIFTDLDLKQRAEDILNAAHTEGEVRIRREDGEVFALRPVERLRSGLDVEGVKTSITLEQIVQSVREGRERG